MRVRNEKTKQLSVLDRFKELASLLLFKPGFKVFLRGLIALLKGNHITHLVVSKNTVFEAPANAYLAHIIKDIFIKKCYERGEIRIEKNDTVVDIGSNVGVFAIFAAHKTENHVFAFEPLPNNYDYLVQNIQANHLQNKITPFKKAVTNTNGHCQLVVSRSSGGNLLDNEYIIREFHNEVRITVETITLEEIFNYTKVDKIDFLKIDCEGSEGAIVMALEASQIKRIRKIAMEYHDNASILSHNDIQKKLESLGCAVTLVSRHNSPYGFIYAVNPACPV